MACPGASRLVGLLRRADDGAGGNGVPSPSSRSWAPRHQAAGTEASARMAANEDNRQSLPAVSTHPASVARTTVSRQSSEVGARCGSAARRDLCGGRPAMAVPTATARTGIWLDWSCAKMVVVEQPSEGAPSMGKSITDLSSVTTVGLDLAKHVFQVHAIGAFGRVIVAKALRRKDVLAFFAQLPECLVGMEACGSAHHWARELIKIGHDARMMPPAYVKPYVRRQKNDAADAAGICEAVTRPSMRFVGVRTLENQAALMHHKAREMLVAQRTQLINALRGHLAEIGVIAAQGPKNARELAGVVMAEGDETIPACVRAALAPLVRQLHALDQEIARSDRTIAAMARGDEMARRLMTIPGLGPVTASAIAASVQDVSAFSGPREFAAFLGLTPRQNSSGGKEQLGRISKMGNRYLRTLLVVGAHAVLYHRKRHEDALRSFAKKLMQTKPFKLVAVALANKMARIAFAIMRGRTSYCAVSA